MQVQVQKSPTVWGGQIPASIRGCGLQGSSRSAASRPSSYAPTTLLSTSTTIDALYATIVSNPVNKRAIPQQDSIGKNSTTTTTSKPVIQENNNNNNNNNLNPEEEIFKPVRKKDRKSQKNNRNTHQLNVGKKQTRTSIPQSIPKSNDQITEIFNAAILPIRFSQDSIACTTKSGMTLDTLRANMKTHGFLEAHAIDIVQMPDGLLTSLDNRRLYVSRRVQKEIQIFKIFARIHSFSDPAPVKKLEGMMKDCRKENNNLPNLKRYSQDLEEKTWGELVVLRMYTGRDKSASLGFATTRIRPAQQY